MPGSPSSLVLSETISRPASRSLVHLPPSRSGIFSSRQSPLQPPPPRQNELPYSSQNERATSIEKDMIAEEYHFSDHEDASGLAEAGPSGSDPEQQNSAEAQEDEEDEDDFDGIEDALPTQMEPEEHEAVPLDTDHTVTLDDLFDDDEQEEAIEATTSRQRFYSDTGLGQQRSDTGMPDHSRATADGRGLVDLSRSSSPRRRGSSRLAHPPPSDTPPSPLPRTPQTDELVVPWSPSPVSERTKARRRAAPALAPSSPDLISARGEWHDSPHPGPSSSSRKGKTKAVSAWNTADDHFDDHLPFLDDDFAMLDQPSGSGSSTSNSRRGDQADVDPGRAFRPTTRHSSPTRGHASSERSHIVSKLDEMHNPTRLLLISDLSSPEQDFYLNHWRRGADKGSKKRSKAAEEEDADGFSDIEFSGPQPSEKKKTFRHGGGFKRGFRGRGRGRGRGRTRK